ncbi:hypothetical protein LSH36_611g03060 [Paralvinella palmiformis]|uniref:Uncharacterized protein n=1 Tax=Paralvinella palmiformis TaxID=53620 RepID=A0AAD9MXA1_9ANNE|nr:hypothetical protein LSH36_611g03060 [Paralvinella palmiformis]
MFSQLHNHYSKISNEIPAMRENLAVLCRTWYIEETCIIPTYAEKCGEAASIFYVGLLNYTKKALADEYHQYGSDMSRLALCSRSVVKKLMKGQLKHQADAGFNGYITKQYRFWKATGDGSDCIDAFNLFHICEEKCGLRLEELIEYYFFQASKFYDTAVYMCSVDLSR